MAAITPSVGARMRRRDAALEGLGWRVLRVPAELVERHIEVAVARVAEAVAAA